MSTISATYEGDATFTDIFTPVPAKSEWGMDTLTRVMCGSVGNLVAFMGALAQAQTYSFNSHTFYLQSWSCDNDNVWPKVTLLYKGLIGGIPSAKVSGKMTSLSASLSCSDPDADTITATRNFSYFAREATYLYIASGRPTGPSNTTLDTAVTPVIWKSSIVAQSKTNGQVTYNGGDAPTGIVTALTPAYYLQSLMECVPVIGTIYFECTDTVQQMATSD